MKVNFDAALDLANGQTGAGVIAQKGRGEFVVAKTCYIQHNSDPFIGEMLACREVMELAVQHGFTHVELETDCLNLIQAWQAEDQRSEGCHVLRELRSTSRFFQGFSFRFVRRAMNSAAHWLARHALVISSPEVIFDASPGSLIATVQSEQCTSGDILI